MLQAQTRPYHHACLKESPTNAASWTSITHCGTQFLAKTWLLLLKRSQPPKMFPSTRSCLGLYAHQVWASPPYFLEAMKRRLDSRLAMCMLLRKIEMFPHVYWNAELHAVFLMTWLLTFNTVDMLFLVCCDRAPWMCQYFTSSNQLLCKSEIDGVHRHSWHATWCLFWG